MNERARNLKDILKRIVVNEEECKEFEKIETISEIYERCKSKGYKGSMEELLSDLISLELLPNEIIEEELNRVAGGKLDAKKSIASILSGLTVMSAGGVNISATQVAPKEVSKKISLSSIKNSLINKLNNYNSIFNKVDRKAAGVGAGVLTAGTLGYYMIRSLRNNTGFENLIDKIESLKKKSDNTDFKNSMESLKDVLTDISSDEENILKELIVKRLNPTLEFYDVFYNTDGATIDDSMKSEMKNFNLNLEKKFIVYYRDHTRPCHYSKNVLESFSEFASSLQTYLKFGLFKYKKVINFKDYKARNLMCEIYFIQNFINEIICKKSVQADAISQLREINAILSELENTLLQKVERIDINQWYRV